MVQCLYVRHHTAASDTGVGGHNMKLVIRYTLLANLIALMAQRVTTRVTHVLEAYDKRNHPENSVLLVPSTKTRKTLLIVMRSSLLIITKRL